MDDDEFQICKAKLVQIELSVMNVPAYIKPDVHSEELLADFQWYLERVSKLSKKQRRILVNEVLMMIEMNDKI